MSYKISIVMPVYNKEFSLMKTFNSIINQTIGFSNIELIIVDDNSTDNSKMLIKELSTQYENINPIYLNINSGSPGKPRNRGVKIASSDNIMFIDCGDTYSKDICEILYNSMVQKNVDLVSCGVKIYFDGITQDAVNLVGNNKELICNPKKYDNSFKDTSMVNKIFKKKVIINNNIHCLEKGFPEDAYFIIDYLFNISKALYLNDFYGYNYIIPTSDEDTNSMSRTVDKKKILNYILGFYKIIDLINENDNANVLKLLSNGYMLVLISYFAKFQSSNDEKIEILNKIFDLEKYIGVSINLNQKWANMINNAILKKKYKKAILYSRIIFSLQNNSFLKKIYRIKINKKSIY
ncbi:glycosyltransferase family 2 protein [Methanobrevibacter acididurans]|uniref:glycosyltransferase family 2 protein n=1 Tax=Methanobrevibacter acididurans TaxID=120963 RepID=UPI0038FC06C9